MGVCLILAEKPSVAADIARVVGSRNKKNGYIEGNKYYVSWCIGHLVTLCEPNELDDKWSTWSLDILPMIPDKFKLKVIKNTAAQFNIVKKLMNSPEVDSIIAATDSGREGELIFRYTYLYAGCRKPFKRLWISSMTDEAIKKGLTNLRPGSDYDNLFYSAKCRSESDWLVGMNATRAFTTKYKPMLDAKEVLSIGRVQTPTLAIIVNRQRERENFSPQDFWLVKNHYNGFLGLWFNKDTMESRIFDRNKAIELVNKVQKNEATVEEVKSENKKEFHPYLYDLTELQRDGNRKYGFTAKQVLNITQQLYETHKLVTYPRTDSQYLSSDIVPTLKQRIQAISVEPYTKVCEAILKVDALPISKRYVDNSKVSDHHCIIPTENKPEISQLKSEERKIYDLIVRRFLSVFLPPHEYKSTTIITSVANELFISKGKTVLKMGWKLLYKNDIDIEDDENTSKEDNLQTLPSVDQGDTIKIIDTELKQEVTKPPALFTESSLLDIMKHADRIVSSEELKARIKTGGLGTPATRDDIIERLIKVGYINRKGKKLIPTPKGMWLIDIVPNELKSPELTAKWEQALDMMARGKMAPSKFMESIKKYSAFIVGSVKKVQLDQIQAFEKSVKEVKVIGQCKECGADVIETSKGWSCSEWKKGCKFSIRKEHPYLAKLNKKVTVSMAKALLTSDSVSIKITNKKTGSEYEKTIRLLKEGQYWNIKFEDNTNTSNTQISSNVEENTNSISKKTFKCPCNKGTLTFTQNDKFTGWSCSAWREGCKISIPDTRAGVPLEQYLDVLCSEGETDYLELKSSKGTFKAKFSIKSGKFEMLFPNSK